MMKIKFLILAIVTVFATINCKAQNRIYQCYSNDNNSNNIISSILDQNYKVLGVYYKGQKKAINLKFIKESVVMPDGGAHPTTYTYYSEIINGKVTGQYTFIHSGNDNSINYINKKTKKQTNFTMTDYTMQNFDSSEPCM